MSEYSEYSLTECSEGLSCWTLIGKYRSDDESLPGVTLADADVKLTGRWTLFNTCECCEEVCTEWLLDDFNMPLPLNSF